MYWRIEVRLGNLYTFPEIVVRNKVAQMTRMLLIQRCSSEDTLMEKHTLVKTSIYRYYLLPPRASHGLPSQFILA